MKDVKKNITPSKRLVFVVTTILFICLLQFSFTGFAKSPSSDSLVESFWLWRFF